MLIECRAKTGWTQAELAQRAGVSRESVIRVEHGRKVRPSILHKLTEVAVPYVTPPVTPDELPSGSPPEAGPVTDAQQMMAFFVKLPESKQRRLLRVAAELYADGTPEGDTPSVRPRRRHG